MAMKSMLFCFLIQVFFHRCMSCESTWSHEVTHSVNSSGVFNVSVNGANINNALIAWQLNNCNNAKEDVMLTFIQISGEDFTTSGSDKIFDGSTGISSYSFRFSETVLSSTLKIFSLLSDYNGSCIQLLVESCIPRILQNLTVTYCNDISGIFGKLNVSSSENAIWNDYATYSCTDPNSKVIVDDNFSNSSVAYTRRCQANATWNGSQNVICSYAPTATIWNTNTSADNTFLDGNNITFLCNITGGNPPAAHARYFVQPVEGDLRYVNTKINQTFTQTLSPDLNNASFTCQGLNEFTNITDQTAGISQSLYLNVLFAPMSVGERSKSIVGALDKTATLSYTFKANPLIDIANLTLTFTSDAAEVEPLNQKNGKLSGSPVQTYEYSVTVESAEQYGLYLLNVTSTIETFDSLILKRNLIGEIANVTTTISYRITSGSDTSAPNIGNTLPTYAIVAPVIGFLVVVLIILIIYMVRKRQHKKDTSIAEQRANPIYEESSANAPVDKEEKINPLYGTSPGTDAEKEERLNPLYGSANQDKATSDTANKKKKAAKSEKVEKKNPLYATSEGSNIVEDAYAEIEKSKNKGNANPVFTVETTGDTYAEVKKPKKDKSDASQAEVTYAEVQKSKRTEKDASLHGISND